MLLVHHDEAEVLDRREDRRAGAYDDPRLAFAYAPPLVEALAVRERAVKDGDALAEARGEALDRLRRERDLRDEDDGSPALREHGGDGLQIDLGLARSRHAEEEHRLRRRLGVPCVSRQHEV